MNDTFVVASMCSVRIGGVAQVSLMTSVAASSESDDFLLLILWIDGATIVQKLAFLLNPAKVTNEVVHIRRTEPATYGIEAQ
ncbi:hypothetical protein TNCV_1141261 [Trichonephila clavipes]|nr:hypothetical protein TNCV_1141261 [Trichonephila clavipes]